MINKGLILKAAAVVSAVSVLIITGCQGGNEETAAVKNKGTVEVSVVEAKGESVNDIQDDGKETVETVVRSNGLKGQDTEDLRNDSERDEEAEGSDIGSDDKGKQPEAEDSDAGREDSGTVSGSEATGAGEGYEVESAVSDISSDTDMGGQYESDLWDGEYTDDTGLGYEDDNSGYEYESEQYDSEYENAGAVESGEGSEGDVSGEPVASVDEGTGESLIYQGTWTISFYCPCIECTGSGNGITASGTYAQPWHTAATSGLDFGTTLYVDGLGYFVVEDRGTDYGWLDLFVVDHFEALALGLQYRDVYLVN